MDYGTAAHVGGVVIRLAIVEPRFSTTEVYASLDDPVDPQLVARVLKQLTEDGWVERAGADLEHWKAGTLTRQYGNMMRYRRDIEGTVPVLPDERRD
jgi:predicted transcriptional regulator